MTDETGSAGQGALTVAEPEAALPVETVALPAPEGVSAGANEDTEGSDAPASDRDSLREERDAHAARGPVGRYIFLFFCAILSMIAVVVIGAGVKDAAGRVRITLPSLFYSEVVNSGVYSLPRQGEGTVISGKVRIPRIASPEDAPNRGALEPDGERIEGADGDDAADPLPILPVDISCGEKDGIGIINETKYDPDPAAIAARERVIPTAAELYREYGDGSPLVLILHTHGTESYSPEGAETYSVNEDFRSADGGEGVVAVGDVIAETLRSRGIGVIHIGEMFDAEDFSAAYGRSGGAVMKTLGENPSVRYVIDVHRDAIITEDGVNLRPVTEDVPRAAQFMTVVGTDAAGADHPRWEDNLAFALTLQKMISSAEPTLMRSVDLRPESFNQQYAPGSILVEAGAVGNSLSEVKRGAAIFAEALADYVIGDVKND